MSNSSDESSSQWRGSVKCETYVTCSQRALPPGSFSSCSHLTSSTPYWLISTQSSPLPPKSSGSPTFQSSSLTLLFVSPVHILSRSERSSRRGVCRVAPRISLSVSGLIRLDFESLKKQSFTIDNKNNYISGSNAHMNEFTKKQLRNWVRLKLPYLRDSTPWPPNSPPGTILRPLYFDCFNPSFF